MILQATERGDAPATASLTDAHPASSHDFILRHLLESGVVEGSRVVPPARVLAVSERLQTREHGQHT